MNKNVIILILIIINISVMGYMSLPNKPDVKINVTVNEVENNIDSLEFSSENLVKVLKDLGVKNYDIVYKQAILETGYFKSNIFKSNNNLFGMKHPYVRRTTSLGSKNGHAFYATWVDSVKDMVFFQDFYKERLNSSKSYYDFLDGLYAEDKRYINKLKHISFYKKTETKRLKRCRA